MGEKKEEKPKPSILTGALGAQFLSLFVPCALIYWTNAGSILGSGKWDMGGLTFLVITAVILCSPGTLVLGLALASIVRYRPEGTGEALKRNTVTRGAVYGAMLAYANIPAYLGFFHVEGMQFLPIIGLGGAMAGGWIGWRIYSKFEPPQPFFPRFSLGTLTIIVLAWATVFFLYAPGVW